MKFILILATLLVASVLDAFASDQGGYAALDVGSSRISELCNILPSTVSCNDTGRVVRLGVGYQFSTTWGAELDYAHLATVTSEGTTTAIAPNGATITVPYGALIRIRGPLLAGVATIPLAEKWFVITKLGTLRLADINILVETSGGANGSWSHIGTTRVGQYWGVGGLYDYTDTISIRAQYEDFGRLGNAATGKFAVKALSLGVTYKFY